MLKFIVARLMSLAPLRLKCRLAENVLLGILDMLCAESLCFCGIVCCERLVNLAVFFYCRLGARVIFYRYAAVTLYLAVKLSKKLKECSASAIGVDQNVKFTVKSLDTFSRALIGVKLLKGKQLVLLIELHILITILTTLLTVVLLP